MAMELLVVDEGQLRYLRAYTWLKLVRVWAALRSDDVQGLLPGTMRMFDNGMEATLDRTKTSGPGKKIRWMKIYVSSASFLWDARWLTAGWEIWQSQDFSFDRDYFLMAPSKDLKGVVRRRASYHDFTRLTRIMIAQLTQEGPAGQARV
eukprot:12426869-Karenia_brevis.AAC.1